MLVWAVGLAILWTIVAATIYVAYLANKPEGVK
jgi:hypothetical protein